MTPPNKSLEELTKEFWKWAIKEVPHKHSDIFAPAIKIIELTLTP